MAGNTVRLQKGRLPSGNRPFLLRQSILHAMADDKTKTPKKDISTFFLQLTEYVYILLPKNRHVQIVSPAARKRANMIQSWHRKTAAKSDTSSWHQFYGVFLSFSRLWCISLIFRTIHHLNNPRHVFVSSKNRAKRLQNSQSCLVK